MSRRQTARRSGSGMQPMNADERMVARFLRSFDLKPERFSSEDNLRWGGTVEEDTELPDFRVKTADQNLFYCEVKSLAPTQEDQPVSFNRLTNDILKATAQFQTVNQSHMVPNVLVWVNHGRRHPDDLILVLKGFIDMSDGERVYGFQRYSEGRIKDLKYNIDLHIWLDQSGSFDEPNWRFLKNQQFPEHFQNLCKWFKQDKAMQEIRD